MTTKLNDALVKPMVETASRVLDIFMMLDASSSMSGLKISVLNQSARESISELCNAAQMQPEVEHRLRSICFSNKARWHNGPDPIAIDKVFWKDVSAGGSTATGSAIQMLVDSIKVSNMPGRAFPPVMVLLSDGANTDGRAYDNAIESLDNEPWGSKAVRLSIGIGKRFDRKQLEKFSNHPEVGVLEAKNAVDLANYIKYATSSVTKAVSQGYSNTGTLANNVMLPAPPAPATPNGNVNLQVF